MRINEFDELEGFYPRILEEGVELNISSLPPGPLSGVPHLVLSYKSSGAITRRRGLSNANKCKERVDI